MLVNCLLNRVVFCLSLVAVLLSNLMGVLMGLFVAESTDCFPELASGYRNGGPSHLPGAFTRVESWICLSMLWLSSGSRGSLG